MAQKWHPTKYAPKNPTLCYTGALKWRVHLDVKGIFSFPEYNTHLLMQTASPDAP